MSRLLMGMLVAAFLIAPLASQGAGDDEKQIRELIAKSETGRASASLPFAKDRIFWSGPYRRPVMGDEKPEPRGGMDQSLGRVAGSQRSKVEVVRLEVAKSGDLAYEFSNVTLSYDLTDGRKITTRPPFFVSGRRKGDHGRLELCSLAPTTTPPHRRNSAPNVLEVGRLP